MRWRRGRQAELADHRYAKELKAKIDGLQNQEARRITGLSEAALVTETR